MVVADLLHQLGVGGGVTLVVSALLTLYHLKHGIAFLSHIATWVQAMALFAVMAVAAAVGLIPGVDLDVALGQLGNAITSLVRVLVDVATALL